MADKQEDVLISPETVELLNKRVGTLREDPENGTGCFLCKRILESLDAKRALRPWPPGAAAGEIEFPVAGQRSHVLLEKQ